MTLALRFLLACTLATVAFADPPMPSGASERRLGEARPLVMQPDREVYGAQPRGGDAVALADVAKTPAAWADKPVRVRGVINSVCQKRGCWMVLQDGGHDVRVRFRDYAFFVPLDVAGRDAVIEGTAKVQVTTEAMRRHYAEDAGKPPAEVAAITGDETSILLMADAVEILGKPAAR